MALITYKVMMVILGMVAVAALELTLYRKATRLKVMEAAGVEIVQMILADMVELAEITKPKTGKAVLY